MFKRSILIATPLCVIAAVGATVAAASDDVVAPSGIATTPPAGFVVASTPNPVSTVEPDALDALPALSQLPVTPMPAADAAELGSSARFGRNPKLARAIKTPTGKAWLIPGRGYVCLAVDDPTLGKATTCQQTDDVDETGLQITLGTNDPSAPVEVTAIPPTDGAVVVDPANGAPKEQAAPNGVVSKLVAPDTEVTVNAG